MRLADAVVSWTNNMRFLNQKTWVWASKIRCLRVYPVPRCLSIVLVLDSTLIYTRDPTYYICSRSPSAVNYTLHSSFFTNFHFSEEKTCRSFPAIFGRSWIDICVWFVELTTRRRGRIIIQKSCDTCWLLLAPGLDTFDMVNDIQVHLVRVCKRGEGGKLHI